MQNLSDRLTIGALLFVCGLFTAPIGYAATFWVSPTGNDSNSCGTVSGESDPKKYKRTIAAGIACMNGTGQTVIIKNGTYTEAHQFSNIPPGTSWSSPNIIKAENRRQVIWRPPTQTKPGPQGIDFTSKRRFIRLEGIVIDGVNLTSQGVKTSGASDLEFIDVEIKNTSAGSGVLIAGDSERIRFADCSVHDIGGDSEPGGAGRHGIYLSGQGTLVERCEIYNILGNGIQIHHQTGLVSANNIVRYNIIRNAGQLGGTNRGIAISRAEQNKVYGNIIYANPFAGIETLGGSADNLIYNNTVYNHSGLGIKISGTRNVVKNNIAYSNGTDISNGASSSVLSNNLTTDPMFVDPSKANFRLKPGSPALDRGVSLSIVTEDFDGTRRPQGDAYDIGAYEYVPSTSSPLSPSNLEVISQ